MLSVNKSWEIKIKIGQLGLCDSQHSTLLLTSRVRVRGRESGLSRTAGEDLEDPGCTEAVGSWEEFAPLPTDSVNDLL